MIFSAFPLLMLPQTMKWYFKYFGEVFFFWIFFKALFIPFCQIYKVVFSNSRVTRLSFSIPTNIPSSNILQYSVFFNWPSSPCVHAVTFRQLHFSDISLEEKSIDDNNVLYSIKMSQRKWFWQKGTPVAPFFFNLDISNSSFWNPQYSIFESNTISLQLAYALANQYVIIILLCD